MNTLPLWFSQPWADRLGWTLVHFLWQGAALTLLYALIRRLARSRTPQGRYAIACLSLAAMTLAPLATWLWISPAAPAPAGVPTIGFAAPIPASAAAITPSPWEQAIPWIVIAWFTGAAAFSVRLAGGWFSATRLRAAGACPAPPDWQQTIGRLSARMRVTRAVRLLVSTLVDTPTVVGWLRPVILTPAGLLAGLPPDQVEALLLHELAHIRRHDFLVNFLQGVAESVLFYHPAVWWISRQIRIEREHCCDDLAAAASGSVLTYARALAELETARPAHRQAVLAANGGSLAARIRRLIHPAPQPDYSFSSAWVLNAVLLSAIGGLAIHAAQDVPRPAVARDASIDRETIWIDTARQGDLKIEVRALGAITSATSAELQVAETQAKNLQPGQPVALGFERRKDIVSGKLTNVRPATANGTVPVDVQVAQFPSGIALNARVDGIIVVGGISNVVHVGRPVIAKANSDAMIFRLDPDGMHATRVPVHFGQSSVNQIEVKSGLQPGDRIIVSDMTAYQSLDRITFR